MGAKFSSDRTWYTILKIDRHAAQQDIEAAHRTLKMRYGQLAASGDEDYVRHLELIEQAFEVLSDVKKREMYDQTLNAGKTFSEESSSPAELSAGEPVKWSGLISIRWLVLLLVLNGILFPVVYWAPPAGLGIQIALVLTVGMGLGIAVQLVKRAWLKAVGVMLLWISLIFNAVYTQYNFQSQWIYLDNQTDFSVDVVVDGCFLCSLDAKSFEYATIRPGLHTIQAYSVPGDSLLEEFQQETEFGDKYLYNVLDAARYKEGRVGYTVTGLGGESYSEFAVSGRWFKLNQDYVLEYPPNEINVKGLVTETTKSYIVHQNQSRFE